METLTLSPTMTPSRRQGDANVAATAWDRFLALTFTITTPAFHDSQPGLLMHRPPLDSARPSVPCPLSPRLWVGRDSK